MLFICNEIRSNRGRESWLMVLLVSGSQSSMACHREVCWVLFCSSFIPVKCLSLYRTDYMPLLITPHYWQLFESQQTDLLLLPPLTWTNDVLMIRLLNIRRPCAWYRLSCLSKNWYFEIGDACLCVASLQQCICSSNP